MSTCCAEIALHVRQLSTDEQQVGPRDGTLVRPWQSRKTLQQRTRVAKLAVYPPGVRNGDPRHLGTSGPFILHQPPECGKHIVELRFHELVKRSERSSRTYLVGLIGDVKEELCVLASQGRDLALVKCLAAEVTQQLEKPVTDGLVW